MAPIQLAAEAAAVAPRLRQLIMVAGGDRQDKTFFSLSLSLSLSLILLRRNVAPRRSALVSAAAAATQAHASRPDLALSCVMQVGCIGPNSGRTGAAARRASLFERANRSGADCISGK